MGYREFTRSLKRDIARNALRVVSVIVESLPLNWAYNFASGIAKLAYLIAARQRHIALEGLGIAFANEKSAKEIERIARESFSNMAKGVLELIYLMAHPKLIKEKVVLEGKDNLDKALAAGRGVIIVSAHFGNFPLMLIRLAKEGFKVKAIIRHMRDPKMEKYSTDKRHKLGVGTIFNHPRNICVQESLKSLKNNEIIFIPLDQNFGTGGIFVEFFGRQAATATGPVTLSLRAKSKIVPVFIVRHPDNTHKVIIESPLDIEEKSDYNQTVSFNILRLTQIIEIYIRRYPAQWGWIHRRWKTQPKEEV